MIPLKLRPIPEILKRNGRKWVKEYMSLVRNGSEIPKSIKDRYRHKEIKEAVRLETNDKCAYCESFVTDQYPGDIEHIIPKTKYPRLIFTWANLTFSCFLCNNNKRGFCGKGEGKLLNPFKDKIDNHLQFFGPMIMHINNSKRGELTWKLIKLNRKALLERREEKLEELQNLVDKYRMEQNVQLKQILHDEIRSYCMPESEFSYTCSCFLKGIGIHP